MTSGILFEESWYNRDSMAIELQQRDLDFLVGLYESRIMTIPHADALYYQGGTTGCRKRIAKLKAEGFVKEKPRKAPEPSVLFLSSKGFKEVLKRGLLDEFPQTNLESFQKRIEIAQTTIKHELAVMDAKASFRAAVGHFEHLRLIEFCTWPKLFRFRARKSREWGARATQVDPDGFIRIREEAQHGTAEYYFFLEVDRSTETQAKTLVGKALAYQDYFQANGLANRFPAEGDRKVPFRVLLSFKNEERRNNTAEAYWRSDPQILRQAWLTTHDELNEDPLGAIWVRPIDYFEALEGSPYDLRQRQPERIYRRDTQREFLVQERVQKQSLFI